MSDAGAGKKRKMPEPIVDIVIALALVASVFLAMFAYTGSWPPIVVVESRSMQHSETTSSIGVMDTGDLVLVKKVFSSSEIVTYLTGKQENHITYGDYGDVLVYWRGGDNRVTPIIHRAVIYLVANSNGSFSAPELSGLIRGIDYDLADDSNSWADLTNDIVIHHYGYADMEIQIPIKDMLDSARRNGAGIHGGFITKGDFNPAVDQRLFAMQSNVPVPFDWIVGKATGEIPWFGILKLWVTGTLPPYTPANSFGALFICLGAIIMIPLGSELFIWWRSRKGKGSGAIPEAQTVDAEKKEEPLVISENEIVEESKEKL